MSNELWRDITCYEGHYRVSSLGNVQSVTHTDRTGRIKKGTALSTGKVTKGYKRVYFKVDTARKAFLVHRLVAQAFIPNPENKPQVNHKDGDKQNNCVENLEWVTSKENSAHSVATGLHKAAKGSKNGKAVLTEKEVELIKMSTTVRNKEIAIIFGIAPNHVSEIRRGKIWRHIIV